MESDWTHWVGWSTVCCLLPSQTTSSHGCTLLTTVIACSFSPSCSQPGTYMSPSSSSASCLLIPGSDFTVPFIIHKKRQKKSQIMTRP